MNGVFISYPSVCLITLSLLSLCVIGVLVYCPSAWMLSLSFVCNCSPTSWHFFMVVRRLCCSAPTCFCGSTTIQHVCESVSCLCGEFCLWYLGFCASEADWPGSLERSAIRGRDSWRRQGDGWRWGCLRALGDARAPPGGRAEMDGGILANRVSCSLISSNINTWTSAAPETQTERLRY